MSPQWFRVVVVTLIQLVLLFGQHSVGADFSDNCDNSTNSLSCIHTYDDLYNSLAKSDNSFNIEAALYPARRPSSVLVFVNLHGPIKADNPMVRYTWSLSCLYVVFPPRFLEVSSLGSILVTPRTQTLNIAIPYFCCNVSKNEDERRKIIKETIKRALSALQDLAISPGIRDPRLNTAECVVEGHKIDIEATGRSVYIKTILYCSSLFTLFVYPVLAPFITYCRKEGWSENTTTENPNTFGLNMKKIQIKYIAKAIFYLGVLLSFLGFSQQLALFSILVNVYPDEKHRDRIFPSLSLVWILILWPPVLVLIALIVGVFKNCSSWLKSLHFSTDLAEGEEVMICRGQVSSLIFPQLVGFTCAATTSFSSCWMLIGIMLNPTWGLTVTLVICFTFASFTCAVYEYLTFVSCRQEKVKPNKIHAQGPRFFAFLAVIFLLLVVVFAGQSFNGRETADETLKTTLIAALGSFISWLSWRRFQPNQILPTSGTLKEIVKEDGNQTPLTGGLLDKPVVESHVSGFEGTSSGHTQSLTSLVSDSLEEIVVEVHEPSSRGTSSGHTQSQTLPIGDSLKEIVVKVHEPSCGSTSAGHTQSQTPSVSDHTQGPKPSAGDSRTDVIVDEVRQLASGDSSTLSTPGQRSLKAGSLTKINDDHIRQPESFRPPASRAPGQDPPTGGFVTETFVSVVNQPVCSSPPTDHILQQANQPPTSETSSDHTLSYQHPEKTPTETQTSSGLSDDQNQQLSEDGPIIGLDEDHPTSDVTSSFHSPGDPPSDPLTVNDHITEESQSSSNGSFIDKSQAVYSLVENGENIESVNEKQRETEITRESNV